MEEQAPRRIPAAIAIVAERTRAEVEAAVALVASRGAVRIELANMPIDDTLAGDAAALAQRAGVAFSVTPDPDTRSRVITVGPRLTT